MAYTVCHVGARGVDRTYQICRKSSFGVGVPIIEEKDLARKGFTKRVGYHLQFQIPFIVSADDRDVCNSINVDVLNVGSIAE